MLIVTERAVSSLSEPSSVPAKNGAASVADLVTRTISQSQLKQGIINQRLDRLEVETERRNQLLSQVQAASVQKDRLIAALQDRLVETEREREELTREAKHWRDHLLQFRNELEVLPLLHRREIAMDIGSGVLVLPTSEPGHFLFGPYLPLQAGRYSVSVRFRAASVLRPNEPVLTVEIAGGEKVLAADVVLAEGKHSSSIEFTVPAGELDANNIEFRFSHHANASLEVHEVQLSALHSTAPKKRRPSALNFLWRSPPLRLIHRSPNRVA